MIQQLINEALLKEQEDRKDRVGSGKISPSALGTCLRRQIYKLKGFKETDPPDVRGLRVFKAGKLFHDFVQGYIPKDSVEILVETDDIKGYADIVGKDTVYDVKSQHSRGFWYMNKEGYDVKKEKWNNWLQLACYGKLLNKEKLCLVVVSKDDLCINEYVEFTKDWIQELDTELELIKRFKASDELPPKEPRLYKGKECDFCNWRSLCKNGKQEG
jgi:CRISPR/Cas system-associated exonuclease Cas4 (RecB family)